VRHVSIAVSLFATCASVALVAQSRYLPDSPGVWKPWVFRADGDPRRVLGARPADVKEVEAQLLRLNAIIKKTPGIANPIGFSVETEGNLDLEGGRFEPRAGEPALTARPLPASLGFGAFPVMEFLGGGTPKRVDTGETATLQFFVNQLTQPLFADTGSSVPEFEKLDADVARLAPPRPDVLGFQRYGDTLVIKKSAAPIWAAVTFAETLDLVARGIDRRLTDERDAVARVQKTYDDSKDPKKREERLAEYRKIAPMVKDPAYMEKMTKMEAQREKQADTLLPQIASLKAVVTKSEQDLASVKTRAAGLSEAEKAAPACYAIGDKVSVSRFRRVPGPGCDPLVRANWKFFNSALPRTAPQLLTIGLFERCLVPDRQKLHVGGCTANLRLIESIDKAALLAWLQ
jgi:hypothetical protein